MKRLLDWTDGRARDGAVRNRTGRRSARCAVLLAAGAAALLAAAPAGAQETERQSRRENCWCATGPSGFWTMSFGRRARMGVTLAWGDDAQDSDLGARIERVYDGSPAEEAGLRAGDIITAIDGRSVLERLPDEPVDHSPAARVSMIMEDIEPGDTIRVDYLRDGEQRSAEVVTTDTFSFRVPHIRAELERAREHLDALRDMPAIRIGRSFAFGSESRFGIRVSDLNDDLGEYFGTTEGVLVTRVDEDSPLELRAGDVIQSVGGRGVEDAAHLREILGTYREDEEITLEVLRRQQRVTVQGRAP